MDAKLISLRAELHSPISFKDPSRVLINATIETPDGRRMWLKMSVDVDLVEGMDMEELSYMVSCYLARHSIEEFEHGSLPNV